MLAFDAPCNQLSAGSDFSPEAWIESMLASRALRPTAKLAALVIAHRAIGRECDLPPAQIAQLMSTHIETLYRLIAELEHTGFVEVIRPGPGRQNRFRLIPVNSNEGDAQ